MSIAPRLLYLSGPMSGLPESNFPAFHAEAKRLRALGYRVVNPAEINPDPSAGWNECLRQDLAELLKCDAIALLPNWRISRGAKLELHVAEALGMRVMEADTLQAPVQLPLDVLASEPVRFTILGQAYSKANSRQITVREDKQKSAEFMEPRFKVKNSKSKEALAYENDALRQIPAYARRRFAGRIRMTICLYYASERPDLDESLLLDVLQDRYIQRPHPLNPKKKERVRIQNGVYQNDRQVRERHVYHFIDKKNPRAEIEVCEVPDR